MTEGIEAVLAEKFARLLPHLDERQRRLALGADARALGYGGIRLVARAAGVSRETVSRGMAELVGDPGPSGRVRREGGGRKRLRDKHPGLVPALLALVEPESRSDPESPLLWTTKSTRKLAEALTTQGLRVGSDTVAALLKEEGFSLQRTGRTTGGARPPDRDAQFRHINSQVREFTGAGQPVISVDTRRKEEAPGGCAVAGREWHRGGEQPVRVRARPCPERNAPGVVDPHGAHDLSEGTGRVPVGCDGDTVAFAVAALRRWWEAEGRRRYPHAARLLIAADAGGSNGCRMRAWKKGLADFVLSAGLDVTVCHFPPGTSKWRRSERRLLSRISTNWRGRPLTSHEVVVNTIGGAGTGTGATVHAEFGPGQYATGANIADEAVATPPFTPHDWHSAWNYSLGPKPPAPLSTPAQDDRAQPADRAPAWLRHPALTGMRTTEFGELLGAVERYLLDHPSPGCHHERAQRRVLHQGPLSLSDRLLVTILRNRWKTGLGHLGALLKSPPEAVGTAVREITCVLEALDRPARPAPVTALTATDLADLAALGDKASPQP
ncbi:ISAzo13 family transposase [Streptomyces sp. NPDC048392]|uniref:ISAzo13 family transposase n=1 Tax=Streptomyces sp. NPDC048392 TaxID=3365543 RepID=UPI003714E816